LKVYVYTLECLLLKAFRSGFKKKIQCIVMFISQKVPIQLFQPPCMCSSYAQYIGEMSIDSDVKQNNTALNLS